MSDVQILYERQPVGDYWTRCACGAWLRADWESCVVCGILNPLMRPVPVAYCRRCSDPIHYQSCPTSGWWIHYWHPDDNHDAWGPPIDDGWDEP